MLDTTPVVLLATNPAVVIGFLHFPGFVKLSQHHQLPQNIKKL
jgi:hypothetical protein